MELDLKSYRNIFQYLQDYYLQRKSADARFSYEKWAKELSYPNRSYLRLVSLGQRPINKELRKLFLNHFSFSKIDGEFFSVLIDFSQSKNLEERAVVERRLTSLLDSQVERLEAEQHTEFLADPLLPILQTLCGFRDTRDKLEALSACLKVAPKVVEEKLSRLKEMGLINEAAAAVKKYWRVPSSYQAKGHRQFYRELFKKAEHAIDLPFSLRRFRSLFVALSPEDFEDFLKDFEVFVQQQLAKRDVGEIKDKRLYQLGFAFFPVSELWQDDSQPKKDI